MRRGQWLSATLVIPLLAASSLVQANGPALVRATPEGTWVLIVQGRSYPCAVGKAGVAPPGQKREGDGRTPSGEFTFRGLYYRPDKVDLELLPGAWRPIALRADDGWCDAPGDPRYNRPVKLPYAASHEDLWRSDDLYDLIVPLGYNDDPVVPGRGSAIFFHVARPGLAPTEGCVAVSKPAFLELLRFIRPGDLIRIEPEAREKARTSGSAGTAPPTQ